MNLVGRSQGIIYLKNVIENITITIMVHGTGGQRIKLIIQLEHYMSLKILLTGKSGRVMLYIKNFLES